MSLRIEFSGQLLPGRPRAEVIELDRDVSVRELALQVGLDPEEVGLAVINGVQAEMEDIVPRDGRLSFFPHLSGG